MYLASFPTAVYLGSIEFIDSKFAWIKGIYRIGNKLEEFKSYIKVYQYNGKPQEIIELGQSVLHLSLLKGLDITKAKDALEWLDCHRELAISVGYSVRELMCEHSELLKQEN